MGIKPKKCETAEEKKLFAECENYIREDKFEAFCDAVDEAPEIITKCRSDDWNEVTLLDCAVKRCWQRHAKYIVEKFPESIFYGSCETTYERLLKRITSGEEVIDLLKFVCTQPLDDFWNKPELDLLRAALESKKDDFALWLLENFKDQIDLKRTFNAKTYLHLAAEHGLAQVVRKLTELKVLDVDAKYELDNWSSKTALCFAVENKHEAVVDVLLESGANPDWVMHPDYKYVNPLHMAIEKECPTMALKLIKYNADCKEWKMVYVSDIKSYVKAALPIHLAASQGCIEVIRALHQKEPGLLEEKDYWGQTPLVHAIANDQYDAVVMFYAYGANFTYTFDYKSTGIDTVNLVQFAILRGSANVLPFLLKIVSYNQIELVDFALNHAPKDKKSAVIKAILDADNCSGKFVDDFQKCLKLLESDECEDLALEYVKSWDVNEKTDAGDTLLHVAAKNARFKVIKELLSVDGIEIVLNAENFLPSMLLPNIPTEGENKKIFEKLIKKEISAVAFESKLELQDHLSATLDVEYKSKKSAKTIRIPGNKIHHVLSANQTYIDEEYYPPSVKDSNGECKVKNNTNYVTATLTFIVSKGIYKKGKVELNREVVTIPIAIEESISTFASIPDKYLVRDVQLSRMAQGVAMVENTISLYQSARVKPAFSFWSDFQHSEQLLMLHLNSREVVERIVDQLIKQNVLANDYKLYGVVVDEHSTKPSCSCCREGHHGFQRHHKLKLPYGFEHQFHAVLKDKGITIHTPKAGVRMLTRISHGVFAASEQGHEDDEMFNMNTPANETILLGDNTQCGSGDDVTPQLSLSDECRKFLLAQNPNLTFFTSGSYPPIKKENSKKRLSDTALPESPSKRQKTGETDNDVVMQESGQPESSVPKLINK